MGIYLPNMEFPKPGEVIRIYNNGEAKRCRVTEQEAFEVGIAFPIPPHGRCIDVDAMEDNSITYYAIPVLTNATDAAIQEAELVVRLKDIDAAPTIIPASKEDK